MPELDDGTHDGGGDRVVAFTERGDEGLVDFDRRNRQSLEVAKRGVARPEVVELQAQAELPKLRQDVAHADGAVQVATPRAHVCSIEREHERSN